MFSMEKYRVNESVIVTKILNELKYNKRLIYNWRKLFVLDTEKKNLRKFLENEVKDLIESVQKEDISLNPIEAIPVYKKISNVELSNGEPDKGSQTNIITFSSTQKIKGEIEYNYFINLSLQEFLLGAIWLESVGKVLDSSLSSNVYANRMSDNKNSFFKPYFKSYTNFRDSNFKRMREWIDNEETGIYVQTDLSRCYYHFNIKKLKDDVDQILENEELLVDKTLIKSINKYIFQIIDNYNNLSEIKEFKKEVIEGKFGSDSTDVLPIGFLPSNVLSNIYLTKLDSLIEEAFYPINYGRYVDDVSFLIRKRINTDNISEDIEPIKKKIEDITIELKERKINLNSSKTIFLIIDRYNDINYLNKFEKETQLFDILPL